MLVRKVQVLIDPQQHFAATLKNKRPVCVARNHARLDAATKSHQVHEHFIPSWRSERETIRGLALTQKRKYTVKSVYCQSSPLKLLRERGAALCWRLPRWNHS